MKCCSCLDCPPIVSKVDPRLAAGAAILALVATVAFAILLSPLAAAGIALTVTATVLAVAAVLTIALIAWAILNVQNKIMMESRNAAPVRPEGNKELAEARAQYMELLIEPTGGVIPNTVKAFVIKIVTASRLQGANSYLATCTSEDWDAIREDLASIVGLEGIAEDDVPRLEISDRFKALWAQVMATDLNPIDQGDGAGSDSDD